MEKFILRNSIPFLVLSLMALSACSPGEVEDVSGLDSYSVITPSNFSHSDSDTLIGSGRVRFDSRLPGISSSRSMALKGTLDYVGQSSIGAVFYSSTQNITDNSGVIVTFTRSGGASVSATVTVQGTASTVNSSLMNFYFPSALDVIIDVHNVGNKVRVYIWRRNVGAYAAATADVDTDASGDISPAISNGQFGAGLFSGLIVNHSTITAVKLSLPKVQD